MELAALAEERAGRGQVVVECLRRELASVVGRLGGRCDEAADLTGRATGVGRSAVSEVLPDGPLLRVTLRYSSEIGRRVVHFPKCCRRNSLIFFIANLDSGASGNCPWKTWGRPS